MIGSWIIKIGIISILPELFNHVFDYGVINRAFTRGLCEYKIFNPRNYSKDQYRRIDDKPYGGGPGMVMKVEPLELALKDLESSWGKSYVVFLSPQGKTMTQELLAQLLHQPILTLVCGRYEGVDERFVQRNVDLELSIGDFVVSGGEFPAMLVIDALLRLMPQVLKNDQSAATDSFSNGLLDHPHYTTPADYDNDLVPEVLLSGNHQKIAQWRAQQSWLKTTQRRPDLINKINESSESQSRLLESIK